MKGKYNGRHMTVYTSILPRAVSIVANLTKVSKEAKQRLKVIDWYHSHNSNISLTSRHFGYTRKTIKGWVDRFKEKGIRGLEDRSRKPKNVRKPEIPIEVIHEVIKIRKKYPRWSKYKIAKILERDDIKISFSSVGRILKRRGLIDKKISRKRRKSSLQPKNRFPKGLKISNFGDLIQIDTKYIMLIGGRKFYQFTAIDVLGKRRILKIYSTQSSKNGLRFLKHCLEYFPFEIKAIQTDNGAPFQKHFEEYCKKIGLTHYFTHPRSPKENTYVEISHRADEEEFYQLGNVVNDIDIMNEKIKEWEYTWNYIRPHQALNYLTPNEYFDKYNEKSRISSRNIITLQT